ncbi:HD domain-containing protein [Pelovirga terrestris]|uniref:HD domain-containing protein n=1 Tax=Pelovirga terrestris TaxID=2771352 RepID=A0A8J6R6R5_9BACT|nr:HD domain-containing protein [Pelovirga terrestris]MBD1401679.1 HD domain-containing protein [Pelovirga terrestris]
METRLKPADLIDRYYLSNLTARTILLDHSRRVSRRALKIARSLCRRGQNPDLQFIAEAAMLHDIGMIFTNAPDIGCHGEVPYLQHGIIGARLLEGLGLPAHARVCERHTGVGLTAAEIEQANLPLPRRNLLPETLEEKIICYADLFYSKDPDKSNLVKSIDKVRKQLKGFGRDKVIVFDRWLADFEPEEGC